MEHIHKIVYINLAKRTDRRAEIEGELSRMGLSGERFEGIERTLGILGCGLSHLAVLKRAAEQEWENVLILEDDFQFIVDADTLNATVRDFFAIDIPWDVFMLSYQINQSKPYNEMIGSAIAIETASAYLVHKRFYATLIQCLETAMPLLEQTEQHWHYANDQCWKVLQPKAQWFYSIKRLGIQRASFSDNSYIFMDRGV